MMARRRPARLAPFSRAELRRDLFREPRLPEPVPGHQVVVLAVGYALVGVALLLCALAAADALLAPLQVALARLP